MKRAARGSLEMQDPKNRQNVAIWAPPQVSKEYYLIQPKNS